MGFGILPFLFFIFVFPELIELAFPIIFIIGLVTVFKSLKKNKAANKPTRNERSRRNSYNQKSANSSVRSGVSNSDIIKIDKKLQSYFEDNMYLNVVEGIDLTTQKGTYTSIDDLYVTYKGEKVCRLSEIRNSYSPVYDRIVSLLLAFSKASKEVLEKKVDLVSDFKPKHDKKKEKKNENVSQAMQYIDRINALNEKIPNEEITNGLYQTCDLLKQIDLSDKKSGADKLGKLYDYYLPILIGVLEKYDELEDSPIRGEEFTKCENQLVKTIILINEALKTIYGTLHEDDYMNLNADITTLQSLLKKDGLVEQPFREGSND